MTKKIPTFLALFIVIAAVASFIYAINQVQTLHLNAQTNINPQDVRITNIKDTSFTVSWLTDTPTIGFVEYKTSNNIVDSLRTQNSSTHSVSIQNLNPDSNYSFTINSEGSFFNNTNSPWQVQTLPGQIQTQDTIISGQIQTQDGLPAKNAIVYVTDTNETWSAQASASGNWVMNIGNQSPDTTLEILVENSPTQIATAKTIVSSANPVPTIKLGSTYDFRNENSQVASDSPNVPIQLP